MNTLEAISKRRSVRSYNNRIVEEEKIEKILKAVYAAPVAGGKHSAMKIAVIQSNEVIGMISDTLKQEMNFPVDPLYGAKTMMILSGDGLDQNLDDNALFANTGVMLENAQIAATELELGSCIIWGTGFAMNSNKELMDKLDLKNGYKPLAGIVFGYSDKEFAQRPDRVTYETRFIR